MAAYGYADGTAKALNTSEILEHILTCLPAEAIVKAQVVSRPWRTLIETSPTLRRRRLLDPGEASDITLTPATDSTTTLDSAQAARLASSVGAVHPLIQSQLPGMFPLLSVFPCLLVPRKIQLTKPALQGIFSWHQGRWRDTFVTQPPVKKMKHEIERFSGNAGTLLTYIVERSDGLRLGCLVDQLAETVKHEDVAEDRLPDGRIRYQHLRTRILLQLE